ncbi:tRNA pseudouridine(38-40) synthase TruA [Occultella glacieicola]|uniref:tRNA pseudouridine(38-40) synthase TruA n=1 Tax=Occultella glacieicola TaxID=2518684 RepID=UPI001F3C30C4|nr:tRNA pseudouridine(38-40) synthase TruA [Occultella glacieicola]
MRLDVAYDGTGFSGWATQPGLRTVQGEIEAGLARVLRLAEPARLTVAGRTDAGVHARGQVAHVDLPGTAWAATPGRSDRVPAEALRRRLAAVLAPDVVVRGVAPAPTGFDARFSAIWRRYCYRLVDTIGARDPSTRAAVTWHGRGLDVDAMDAAARDLVGEHDFASYCKPRPGATTIRTLQEFSWRRDRASGVIEARVRADAFCHSMVRALVGGCLVVGEGRAAPDWPGLVLAAQRRDPRVTVAPARGLTLEEVAYPPDGELAARARVARAVRTLAPKD